MHPWTFLNTRYAGRTLPINELKRFLQLTRFLWGRLMSKVVGRLPAFINTHTADSRKMGPPKLGVSYEETSKPIIE